MTFEGPTETHEFTHRELNLISFALAFLHANLDAEDVDHMQYPYTHDEVAELIEKI